MTKEERIALFDSVFKEKGFITVEMRKWLIGNGFFTAPASTKYHGAYEGGLFDHSYGVMQELLKYNLTWENERSPYIVGMFHDLCKIDQYIKNGDKYVFNRNTDLKGHGDKSVIMLERLMPLTEEEIMCIEYHMGAFVGKEEWSNFTDAIHKYANVLWTHQADMVESHILAIN